MPAPSSFIADVLPAGHLHEHQQAQLIAGIQKSRALGGMAGAHCIAAKVFFQDLGIQLLDAVRHGIALIGVALVAVQAPQLHPLAVQVKPPATNWMVRKPNRVLFSSSTRSGRPLVPGRISRTVRV